MAYYRWANTYITITYPYLIIISTPTFYLCSFVLFTPPVNIITYPYPHFISARSPTYQYCHLPLPTLYICSFPHLSIWSPTPVATRREEEKGWVLVCVWVCRGSTAAVARRVILITTHSLPTMQGPNGIMGQKATTRATTTTT